MNILIVAILLVILGGAIAYICKAKRNGARCVGCSQAKNCSGDCCGCRGM